MNEQRTRFISKVEAYEFLGREREMDALIRHAGKDRLTRGMLVLSPPSCGGSELLRQYYDRLFPDASGLVPIYFAFSRSDRNIRRAGERFVREFLRQLVSFRRQDEKYLNVSWDLEEIAQTALPSDGVWIDRLLIAFRMEGRLTDEAAFVDTCFTAPMRAAANGVQVLAIFDDLHELPHLEGAADVAERISGHFLRADIPFVLGGRRRYLSKMEREGFEILPIGSLDFPESGALVETLARNAGVVVSPEARDLITVQFNGNPLFINFMIQGAAENNVALEKYQQVQQVYVDELCGGRIGRYYDDLFAGISSRFETQRELISLVHDAMNLEAGGTHAETWQPRTGLAEEDFQRAMMLLNVSEAISLTTNIAEASPENRILSDYLSARHTLEIDGRNRGLTVGALLAESLKRAPLMMTRFYRRKASMGLREVLGSFNGQEIPAGLIDYARFKADYKGMTDEEFEKTVAGGFSDMVVLPEIVYSAHTGALYPALEQLTERERSAAGFGFSSVFYTADDEIVWLAAEIDVKLEAARDVTEFWCDWLEMVAQSCNFPSFKIWLVSPEGFQPEALEFLEKRRAFGSSRRQVELLKKFLSGGLADGVEAPDEYEIAVPMKGDTELIVAQTVEEIARRHKFPQKAINQIKTALVEACINAQEHSLSPDQKIYQKFSINEERLMITVSNRGLKLNDRGARELNPSEGRRGWGLKLMRSLMDDVHIHQIDEGTKITMTKLLPKDDLVEK